jgi:hypothetical protein
VTVGHSKKRSGVHEPPAGRTARAARPRITTSRTSRGQSLVEFALVLPVLLLLLVITVDFGRAYLGWVTLNNVVREAANFAAENPTAWSSANSTNPGPLRAYTDLITNDAAGIDCALPTPLPAPVFPKGADGVNAIGTPATVTITCRFSPITPIISSVLGNSVPITASAAFPIRYGLLAVVGPAMASPTIATALSTSSGPIGTSVNDSATLSGATPTAGGSVTYTYYTDSACSAGATAAGTVTVSGGVVPDSTSVPFNTAGTYYWQAAYSGDASNASATSPCTSEILTIDGTSITTALSASSVRHGASVYDTATLSGVTSTAGGMVTYRVYTDSACTAGAQDAGTVNVTARVVPPSTGILFGTAGTYYWQAVYTPDASDASNKPATSSCTSEILYVDKMCTVPDLKADVYQNVKQDWVNAGFTSIVLFDPQTPTPPDGTNIKSQSIPWKTSMLCIGTAITVKW